MAYLGLYSSGIWGWCTHIYLISNITFHFVTDHETISITLSSCLAEDCVLTHTFIPFIITNLYNMHSTGDILHIFLEFYSNNITMLTPPLPCPDHMCASWPPGRLKQECWVYIFQLFHLEYILIHIFI